MSLQNVIDRINAEYKSKILAAVKEADAGQLVAMFSAGNSLTVTSAAAPKRAARASTKVASPKKEKKPRAKKEPKAPRVRRTNAQVDLLASGVAAAIKDLAGGSIAEIAKHMEVPVSDLSRPIKIALDRKTIHMVGTRRAARYLYGAASEA